MSERARGYGHYNTNNRNTSRGQYNSGEHEERDQRIRGLTRQAKARREAAYIVLLDPQEAQPAAPPAKKHKVRPQGGGNSHPAGRPGPSHYGSTPSGSRHANNGSTPYGKPSDRQLLSEVVFKTPGSSVYPSRHPTPPGAFEMYQQSLRPSDGSWDIIHFRNMERARFPVGACLRHLTNHSGCDGHKANCDGYHNEDQRKDHESRPCPELASTGHCSQGGWKHHYCFFHPLVDFSKSSKVHPSGGSTTVHLSNPQRVSKPSYGLELSGDADWDARYASRHADFVQALISSADTFSALKAAYIEAVDTSLSPSAQCNKLLDARWQHRRIFESRFGLQHIYAEVPTEVPLPDHVLMYCDGSDPRLPEEVQQALNRDEWDTAFIGYPYGPDGFSPYHPFEKLLSFKPSPFLPDGSINPDVADLLPYGASRDQAQVFLQAAEERIRSIKSEADPIRIQIRSLDPRITALQAALMNPVAPADDPRHVELADMQSAHSSAQAAMDKLSVDMIAANAAKAKSLATIAEHHRLAQSKAAAATQAVAPTGDGAAMDHS